MPLGPASDEDDGEEIEMEEDGKRAGDWDFETTDDGSQQRDRE